MRQTHTHVGTIFGLLLGNTETIFLRRNQLFSCRLHTTKVCGVYRGRDYACVRQHFARPKDEERFYCVISSEIGIDCRLPFRRTTHTHMNRQMHEVHLLSTSPSCPLGAPNTQGANISALLTTLSSGGGGHLGSIIPIIIRFRCRGIY